MFMILKLPLEKLFDGKFNKIDRIADGRESHGMIQNMVRAPSTDHADGLRWFNAHGPLCFSKSRIAVRGEQNSGSKGARRVRGLEVLTYGPSND
jgi:hypothetical protein